METGRFPLFSGGAPPLGPDVAELTNNWAEDRKGAGAGGWNKLIANFCVFDGIRLTCECPCVKRPPP